MVTDEDSGSRCSWFDSRKWYQYFVNLFFFDEFSDLHFSMFQSHSFYIIIIFQIILIEMFSDGVVGSRQTLNLEVLGSILFNFKLFVCRLFACVFFFGRHFILVLTE